MVFIKTIDYRLYVKNLIVASVARPNEFLTLEIKLWTNRIVMRI